MAQLHPYVNGIAPSPHGRGHEVAVDDVAQHAPASHGHDRRRHGQRAGQQPVLAADLGWVRQVVNRRRRKCPGRFSCGGEPWQLRQGQRQDRYCRCPRPMLPWQLSHDDDPRRFLAFEQFDMRCRDRKCAGSTGSSPGHGHKGGDGSSLGLGCGPGQHSRRGLGTENGDGACHGCWAGPAGPFGAASRRRAAADHGCLGRGRGAGGRAAARVAAHQLHLPCERYELPYRRPGLSRARRPGGGSPSAGCRRTSPAGPCRAKAAMSARRSPDQSRRTLPSLDHSPGCLMRSSRMAVGRRYPWRRRRDHRGWLLRLTGSVGARCPGAQGGLAALAASSTRLSR